MTHYTYVAKCSDETYYCGYTTDLAKRIKNHNESRLGAKYTKSRRPVELVYSESFSSKSEAMRRECEIKSLTRDQKEKLISKSQT